MRWGENWEVGGMRIKLRHYQQLLLFRHRLFVKLAYISLSLIFYLHNSFLIYFLPCLKRELFSSRATCVFFLYVCPCDSLSFKKIYNAALTTTKWIFLLPTHSSLDLSSFFFVIFSQLLMFDMTMMMIKKIRLYHPRTTTSNNEKAIFIELSSELSVERQPAVIYVPRMRDNLYLCDVKKCVCITTRTMTMRRRLEWTMLTYIKYWVLWCAIRTCLTMDFE